MTKLVEKNGRAKGILDPKRLVGKFETRRFHPPAWIAESIAHFWEVTWALENGETFVQHNIPYPAVHIVFEKGCSEVVGPISGRFTREIVGRGRVIGAHIKPGMFRMFSKTPVHEIVDQRRALWGILPSTRIAAIALEEKLLGAPLERASATFADTLRDWEIRDEQKHCESARDLVALIESDPTIVRAEDLAKLNGLSLRSLQRLFREYVGLSPKLVIRRFRLLEAAERLLDAPATGAEVAAELGYADQAHFIRDFKKMVGTTPAAYRKRNF